MDNLEKLDINVETLVKAVKTKIKPDKLFYLAICGDLSHGITTKEPDLTIKGSFMNPFERVIGFWSLSKSNEYSFKKKSGKLGVDVELLELSKTADRFFIGTNGQILEETLTSIPLYADNDFAEYKQLVEDYFISKKLYEYYAPKSQELLEAYEMQKNKEVLPLLRLYRMLLTGIHLFETGKLVVNFPQLLEEKGKTSNVQPLLSIVEEDKSAPLSEKESDFHIEEVKKLSNTLEETFNKSHMPAVPRNKYKISRHINNLYKSRVLEVDIEPIYPRAIEDKDFMKKAKQKNLLSSNLLYKIQKECGQKLVPTIHVYVPEFTRMFHHKQEIIPSKLNTFVDVELFFTKLWENNPYFVLALLNPYSKCTDGEIANIAKQKDSFISKELAVNFKKEITRLQEKIKASKEDISLQDVLFLFALQINYHNLLDAQEFDYTYSKYSDYFKELIEGDLNKDAILKMSKSFSADAEKKEQEANLPESTLEKEFYLDPLVTIKKIYWMRQF